MSYKLNDIRDLRIDWRGDYCGGNAASIHFESGNERFHIWLLNDAPGGTPVEKVYGTNFSMADTLYANPIEGTSRTKFLELKKSAHSQLRDLINKRLQGEVSLNEAVYKAAALYVAERNRNQAKHRADLAANIRTALMTIEKPSSMAHELLKRSDDELIELRRAIYSAKYPDEREYDASGTVKF